MKAYKKTQTYLCMLLVAMLGTFQASAQIKNYTINGSLKGFDTMPQKIYLSNNIDAKGAEPKVDSVTVVNGSYHFKGSTDIQVPLTIGVSKNAIPQEAFVLMLDQGDIELISNGTILNTTVSGSGSSAHKELSEVTDFAKKEYAEINRLSLMPEYKSNDSLKKALQNRATNVLGNALVNVIKYVRKKPQSAISPYLTYSLLASGFLTPAMADTLSALIPDDVKSTSLGKAIKSIEERKNQAVAEAEEKRKELDAKAPLGSLAKVFTMNDVIGNPISLDAFKGKYVLIDFWASWCKPCREENPNLVKAYAKYKDKGFDILGVSLDGVSQKTAWITAIKDDRLSWRQVSDLKGMKNEAAVMYGVESIPQNFLIDPKGKIIAKNLRGSALEEELSKVFK